MTLRKPHLERLSWLTLGLMTATLPLLAWGLLLGFRTSHNSPISWLPEDSRPRQRLLEFIDQFQTEDMIVVSWDGCTLEDPRLPKFAEIVRQDRGVTSPQGGSLTVEQTNLAGTVLDGYNATEKLIWDLELSREEAVARLQGLLVGRDGKTSCALLPTHFRDLNYRQNTVDYLTAAASLAGVPDQQLHLAGAYVEGVAIDQASARSFRAYVLPSAVLVGVVCWFCLRSWKLAWAVLSVAGYCALGTIGVLYPLGIKLNAVLIVMAPLLLVLSVSAGIHLVNYYLDYWRHGSPDPAGRAIAAGWWPCCFCTLTTSIGMGTLTLSEIVPVRQFGAITAAGVLVSLGLLLLVLPGVMSWHGRTTAAPPRRPLGDAARWRGLAAAARRGWAPITVCGLAVVVAGAYGMTKVQTSVNVMKLLNEDHRLVSDYRWLEQRLGPLVPIEVLVHFDDDSPLDDVQRLELVRRVERQLYEVEALDSVFSGSTFLPVLESEGGFGGSIQRTMLRRRMDRIKRELRESSWLADGDGRESWRISARMPAFGGGDYDAALTDVQRKVNHAVAHEMADGVEASFTGLAPVVSHSQQMLLNDLFRSLAAAICLVALVMTVVFRSVRAGLLAMIPNVFPTVVLFGAMGLRGIPVDIGTVMTASVALGIAVDDTIHFLTWFRREHQEGGSRSDAVLRSFSHCATAMMQTTAVCGLGLACFVMADFVPTAQFAWMMIALLALAIVGDLLLLPALLSSPLGAACQAPSPEPQRDEREAGDVAVQQAGSAV